MRFLGYLARRSHQWACGVAACSFFLGSAAALAADVVATEVSSSLMSAVVEVHTGQTGERIDLQAAEPTDPVAAFCASGLAAGAPGVLSIEVPLTPSQLEVCRSAGSGELTEVFLGYLNYGALGYEVTEDSSPILLYVKRDHENIDAYRSLLQSATDEVAIGDFGYLPDFRGLIALSDEQRDAARQAASDLPVYDGASAAE